MPVLLLDDRGEFWSDSSHVIRESFASAHAAEGFAGYLVKNLGFVAIDSFPNSCQIRFRPEIITQATFEAVVDWLAEYRFERIVLAYFLVDDWRLELVAATDRAVERLIQLVNTEQLARPQDFIAETRESAAVETHPVLRSLLASWPTLSQGLHEDSLRQMLRQLTNGRFTLVRYDHSDDRMTIVDAGSGYLTYGSDWPERSRGAPMEHQPDRDYGRWVVDTYRKVLDSRQPTIHDVDAIVSTPKWGRYRLRYKRLILPHVETSASATWLLCSSAMDHGVDLRLLPGAKKAG